MSDDNIINMEQGKKKVAAKKKPKANEDLTFNDLRCEIARAMDGDVLAPKNWPNFPVKFHKMVDPIGKEIFLEETDDRLVKFRSKEYPPQVILKYAVEMIPSDVAYGFKKRDSDEVFYWWRSQRKTMEQRPAVIAQKSEDRLAFARLPFDLDDIQDPQCPPLFDEFLGRCSNKQALAAFIGSLFFPESYMQQYLYLHGAGQDGKSTVINSIRKVLGDGYQTISPRLTTDRFWFMKTYGKRLCVVPDLGPYDAEAFPSSPELKTMTGGDPIFYEAKKEGGFTDDSISKIIIASNWAPAITGQKSDGRRLIYCKVDPLPEGTEIDANGYAKKMDAEAKAIIEFCVSVYKELCPNHQAIPAESSDELAESSEEHYISIFEKHFVSAPGSSVAAYDVRDRLRSCGIMSNHEIKKVKACWQRRYGVISCKKNDKRVYFNLKIIFAGIPRGEE